MGDVLTEHNILLFMTQVLVVLGLARILGEVFRRFKQPPLAGEILAGILLGQTVFGRIAPELFTALFPADELQHAMFDVCAELGILFLLLVVGLEINVASTWKMRKRTFTVAFVGVLIPLVLGTSGAWLFYEQWAELPTPRLAFSLMVGAGVAITAITVVARLLFDLKIIKSDLGLFLISTMALNELLGWVVLAAVLSLAGAGTGEPGVGALGGMAGTMGGIVLFAAFATTIGRWLTTRALRWIDQHRLPTPAAPVSLVVCLGLTGGIVTLALGVHPVFGFLLAGVMAGDPHVISEHTRAIISQMVEAVFVPLFFAGICLHVDFSSDFNLLMVVSVTTLSVGGKFIGAWVGTVIARMPSTDRVPVAAAHIPGGPMGVLLAGVAKEADIIGPKMFVALVVASIVSALLVGPAFAWTLRRRLQRTPLRVARFFGEDRIINPMEACSTTDAIEVLAELAAQMPGAPPATVIRDAAIAREGIMGTGLGNGIACPHVNIAGLPVSIVLLGISKDGIDWNAVDGKPVHLVFLLVTPKAEPDVQLEIFAAISRALADPRECRSLLDARDASAAWKRLKAQLSRVELGARVVNATGP